MTTQPSPRPSRFSVFGRSLSLERKLPLLMTGVLVIVLGVSLALTYRTLADAAREAAAVRLFRAVRQLASSIEVSMNQRAALQRRVASDSAVRRVLEAANRPGAATGLAPNAGTDSPAVAAARTVLTRLTTPTDSGVPIELWTDDGRRLIRLGRDSLSSSGAGELAELSPSAKATGTGIVRPDSVRIGAFYESAGHVFFGISTPVYDGARRLGYVAELHRISVQPAAEQTLRELFGDAISGRYRNRSGSFWSTLNGAVVAPLERPDSAAADSVYLASRAETGALFVSEAPIVGTPWALVLELPASGVFGRMRATMLRLALLSLLLVVAGAVASWIISRRITRPLATLSAAADALAHGDDSRFVDDAGGDEVAHLARSFNHMRDEVGTTRGELEAQIEEAQSVTEELEQANEQLRQAMEAAEQANRAKSDFLAVMSHELRTPLNAIGGYVELLDLGIHGPVTEAQRDALARAARNQKRLLTLINDVLNFARLDAGHVEYNWSDVPLDITLAALEPLIAPQVRTKHLTYTYVACSRSLTVHTDHDRLQQIVLNLLSNAIKFTPEHGSVTVECVAEEDVVFIHVRDTGCGIPADRLRTIFDPFVQVDRSLNRPHEGVGLGLSISRELARGMGGDLTVESEPGKGSVFTVRVCRTNPVTNNATRVTWATLTPEKTAAVRPDRAS